jgi:predicted phosphodiesterase
MKLLNFFISFCCLLLLPLSGQCQQPERGDTRIVVISDMNESYGSTHYDRWVDSALVFIEQWQPDAVVTAGDHIAGQSLRLDEQNIHDMWMAFEEVIAAPIRQMGIPFGVTMGNHDASRSRTFDHEREIAREYWTSHPHLLDFLDGDNYPFYYSFMVNDLFIVSWDATYHEISEEELQWLSGQLQTGAAQNASQRILLGHLPLYAVAEGRNRFGEILRDADELFEMLRDGGIDIYISGHHHAWYPAKKDAVLLLSAGAIGSGPRPLLHSELPSRRTITVIDFFDDSGNRVITTYDMENGMKEILPDELPGQIEGLNGVIKRYDYRQ